MPGGLQAGFQSVSDGPGTPAAAIVSTNTRVQTATGYVGLVSDIVSFAGTSTTGNWVVGATRMTVNGVPVINASAQGLSFLLAPPAPPVPTSPMHTAVPDSRAQGM
jgi:hypothetical protein